ncbi:CAP domain-containing protein [Kangiella geojedonensis]|uniref:CAP domain-containing protein n=1 Tax=Kangiella geojedonensis TaxID=914150 RepID=UPI000698062B|nr:CAP domain-containing protein [Kangiella geojedonensis]
MLKNGLILLSSFSLVLSAPVVQAAGNSENETTEQYYEGCGLNKKSRALAKLIREDQDQLRKSLSCSSLLSKIAQKKAEEMAEAGKVTHYGVWGSPNERLIKEGYRLDIPEDAVGSNYVEAVQGGEGIPETVLDRFKNSYQHRVHLFGEHDFFLAQDQMGVGYAYNWESPHVDYWVVYIAREKASAENTKADEK